MDLKSNRLIPILGVAALGIVGTIFYVSGSGDKGVVKAESPMKSVPLPESVGADKDTPQETLATVTAANQELRRTTEAVLEKNKALEARLSALETGTHTAPATADFSGKPDPASDAAATVAAASGEPVSESALDTVAGSFKGAVRQATSVVGGLSQQQGNAPRSSSPAGVPAGLGYEGNQPAGAMSGQAAGGAQSPAQAPAAVTAAYTTIVPMGYADVSDPEVQKRSNTLARVQRTSQPVAGSAGTGGPVDGTGAGREVNYIGGGTARTGPGGADADIPYFTIPENSTLTGVTAMTSIIGRVPIDGKVTDPMQFKAIVGRENLAANGWQLPDDLSGMIVSGVAIGDMALSCSEGKIKSLTFIFNDGTIRTVSTRASRSSSAGGANSGAVSGDLGYISDLHGNPCIAGRFVTNAPRYLADIVGLRTLGVAAQSYAAAETQTVSNPAENTTTSTVTGNRNKYVLGQAAAAGADEVTNWLLSRMKSSFDAVISPAGQKLVVHIDQELLLDKTPNGRKLVHRQQAINTQGTGGNYGLE